MPFRIVPIVEGQGEVLAVPELLRRVIIDLNPPVPIDIRRPIRQARGSLLKLGGIEAAVGLAAITVQQSGVIFILLDSEGSCPAELGTNLLARARKARSDKAISVVLAHHEFEAWFLAAASSLRGKRGLSDEIQEHEAPETVADCKGWLERWMPPTSKYSETIDQPALAALFDFELAKKARSFQKLYSELERICQSARSSMES